MKSQSDLLCVLKAICELNSVGGTSRSALSDFEDRRPKAPRARAPNVKKHTIGHTDVTVQARVKFKVSIAS